jgi:hypothetical protein
VCLGTLTLSWEILADAAGVRAHLGDRPVPARASLVLVLGARGVRAFLEVSPRPDTPAERLPLGNAAAALTLSEGCEGDVHLVHATAPGMLRATFIVDTVAPPRVLYARTPLLASLGVAGGACDRPVGAWERGTGGPC